jgi:hypothetical protein
MRSSRLHLRTEYYRRLRLVAREQDWSGWLVYMIAAVRVTAGVTLSIVRGIIHLME